MIRDTLRGRAVPRFLARINGAAMILHIPSSLTFVLAMTLLAGGLRDTQDAWSQPVSADETQVRVFTTPDESSLVIESVRSGETLAPMAEMTGAGGLKWFMVKTRNGNIGWIKTGDNPAVTKIDRHFRSLPNEIPVIGAGAVSGPASKAAARGPTTIPVQVRGSKVIVSVTFNNTVAANLLLDTGASRTMVSSRIAKNLGLQSTGSGVGYGIGGYVALSTARVESIKVGEAEMQNLQVSIHDFSPDPSFEGLLGFDFLRHFHMSLDLQKPALVLTPRNVT